MLLHPLQGHPLIQEPGIQIPILPHLFACQESKGANSVVQRDKHDAMSRLLDDLGSVIIRVGILGVPSPLDEDPNREPRSRCCIGRTKNVHEQAIFFLYTCRNVLIGTNADRAVL